MNLRINPEELIPKPGARERIRAAGEMAAKGRAERAERARPKPVPVRTEADEYREAFEALAYTVRLAVAVICAPSPELPKPKPLPYTNTRIILQEVADKYAVTIEDLRGPRRHHHVSWARQEAFYRLHEERKNLTLPMIGRLLHKDHTTVLYGVRRHAKIMGLPDPSRKAVQA